MTWIKLDDGTFAEEATPDPKRILTTAELQEVVIQKQSEIVMYEKEITSLIERKEAIETEIIDMEALIS